MSKNLVLTASVILLTAIILGAMAAHALEKIISTELIETFEKGVRYQFYGGFALLITGAVAQNFKFSLRWFTILTIAGVLLFSGCIYGYCFHEQIPPLKPLVYIVPIGGFSMIFAWLVLIIQLIRFQK